MVAKHLMPADERYMSGYVWDLFNGNYGGPSSGYTTKRDAEKGAKEWIHSGHDCHARIVKFRDRYWVYVR